MRISALDRKLLRDLWHVRGQGSAIAAVVAAGVAIYVMAVNTLLSLGLTQDAYYERYRFAHVFAHLTRASTSLIPRIEAIPGVAAVEARVVERVTLDVPGMPEPAVGRVVSVHARGDAELNRIYLRRGRHVDPSRTDEVMVSEGFAQAHNLHPGDTLTAVLNGRRQSLRVVGVALSPEFIYVLPDGEVLPDDRRYAVLWMGRRGARAAFNMQGAFNDVCLTLLPGANQDEVIARLDRLLEPYGCAGAYGRADQSSAKFVDNEIEELRGTSVVIPAIFLAVGAFLFNVVVTRVVQTQREQIATLKAFGYGVLRIGWHYGKFVLAIALGGVAVGAALGVWMGRGLTRLYTEFFHFPVFLFRVDPGVMVMGVGVTLLAAGAATATAVGRAVRLPPAEAMRPAPPPRYRPTTIERWGWGTLLSPGARMIVRQLERRWAKSLVTCAGIGMAGAVLVLGNFTLDAVNYVMESEFQVAQRQDVTVALTEPDEDGVLFELARLPGVRAVEGYRVVAARVRAGHRSRRVGITGLQTDAHLYRLMDVHRRKVRLGPEGVVLSRKLAEVLGVSLGDTVVLEILEDRRVTRPMNVVGLVSDFTGLGVYMRRQTLNRLLREGPVISGAHLSVAPHRLSDLYTQLKHTPHVAGVTLKGAALQSFQDTVAKNLLRMRLYNVGFACVIAFGVVYNAVRISLSERARDLATLRVIGFTRGEVSTMLLGELGVLVAGAIPLGLLMGYALAWVVVTSSYDTELFRIPLVVSARTYAFAAGVVLGASVLSGLIVRRRVDRLDLVGVLKSRE